MILKQKNSWLLWLPVFALISIQSGLKAQNKFITDSLDQYVSDAMKLWKIPGVAIAVVKDGKVILSKGYGVRQEGRPEKVDENTLFMIASNSKAFTATSLALLDYQKRLSLDDKVTSWMPGFRLYDTLATREVTIRDLLCHRIGFETFQSDFLNWGSTLSRKELILNVRNSKPVYSFRSKYGYCNIAFLTAGEIIPLACDTSWDDFLKFRMFTPLKMQRTSTTWKTINTDANAAKPYTLVGGKLQELPYVNVDNLGPAGSLNSSVKDLSNWLLMQLDSGRFDGKEVIPYRVLQQTRNSHMIAGNPSSSLFPSMHFNTYGLGWFLNDYAGRKIIHHDGGANGFVTTTCFIPEENLGIIVLTNTDANNFYTAMRLQLMDAFLEMPYKNYSNLYYERNRKQQAKEEEKLKKDLDLVAKKQPPSLPVKNYAGKYVNTVYGKMEVKEENGKLKLYFEHHPTLIGHLEPREVNTFLCTYSDPTYGVKVIPFEVKEGRVVSATITVADFIEFLPYEFKRAE